MNEGMSELRTTVLQNRTTLDYLWLRHNLGCHPCPGMCGFDVSDVSHTVGGQINDLHRRKTKSLKWPLKGHHR